MVAGWGSLATSCTSAPPPSLAALCTKPAAEVQYTQSSNTASPRTLSTSLQLVSVNNDPVVLTTPPPDDDPVPRLGVEGEGGNVSPAAVCPVQRVLLGVQGEVLGLIHHAVV